MSTPLTKLVQFFIVVFTRWATPLVFAVIATLFNKTNYIDPGLLAGHDPQAVTSAVISVVASVIVFLLTALLKVLSKYVARVQQLLLSKGLLDKVDGWLGPRTFQALVHAVNNNSVTFSQADVHASDKH